MEILYLLTGLVIGIVFGWVIKLLITKSETSRLEVRNKLLENSNNETAVQLNAEREKVIKPNNKFITTYDFATIEKNRRFLL